MIIKEAVEKQHDKSHAIYNITVDRADAKKLFEEAKTSMAQNAGVQAKPGTDPYPALAQRFTTKEIEDFISDYVTSRVTPILVTQKKLPLAMEPTCHLYSKADGSEDLTFRATFTLKPSFKLSSYAPVSVKIPSPDVTDQDVDEQLSQVQQMAISYETVEAANGIGGDDLIDVDIVTKHAANDQRIEHLCGEGRLIDLAQPSTPNTFKIQIVGMKPGESRTFSYDNPENHTPDAAGNPAASSMSAVETTVKLNGIKKAIIPDINDAWVKDNINGADTIDEFRALIKHDIADQKKQYADEARDNAVDEELAKRLVGTIPDDVFEHSQADMANMFGNQLKQQNMTMEDFLAQNNLTEDQWRMQSMMQVRSMLRSGYALDALADERGIEATKENVQGALAQMAPGREQEVLASFQHANRMYTVEEVARRFGAHQWLVENSNYEYIEE